MNIKDDWQVRLCYKRASSRFENGNCDHKKDPFFLENTVDLIDLTFEETIGRFNGFQETIEHFNGFEETIGNFQWFLRRPSPLNVFWQSDHCHQWFFNGFWYCYHRFQWFSMVLDHWSNDAMVSMDRYGLVHPYCEALASCCFISCQPVVGDTVWQPFIFIFFAQDEDTTG